MASHSLPTGLEAVRVCRDRRSQAAEGEAKRKGETKGEDGRARPRGCWEPEMRLFKGRGPKERTSETHGQYLLQVRHRLTDTSDLCTTARGRPVIMAYQRPIDMDMCILAVGNPSVPLHPKCAHERYDHMRRHIEDTSSGTPTPSTTTCSHSKAQGHRFSFSQRWAPPPKKILPAAAHS